MDELSVWWMRGTLSEDIILALQFKTFRVSKEQNTLKAYCTNQYSIHRSLTSRLLSTSQAHDTEDVRPI